MNLTKIIFLDHDGVICLANNWGKRFDKQRKWGRSLGTSMRDMPVEVRFDDFDKKAITVLNKILSETDAEIVVSSDWKKWANLEELGQFYEMQGIVKKPIALTPSLGECEVPIGFPWSREFDLDQTRTLEIQQWLRENPQVTHWVAIDDLDMRNFEIHGKERWERSWGLSNFVWTTKQNEGIKQTGIKDKILKFITPTDSTSTT